LFFLIHRVALTLFDLNVEHMALLLPI